MGTRQRPSFYKIDGYYKELLSEESIAGMKGARNKVFDTYTTKFKFKEVESKSVRYALSQIWNVSNSSMIIETQSDLSFKKGDLIIINGSENDISEITTKLVTSNNLRGKTNTRKISRLLIG